MENEVWKDVKGYEGLYQVSNLGRVKSFNFNQTNKEKIRKLTPNCHGYLHLTLSKNGVVKVCKVHQLVAIAFLNHTPCGLKLVVNHINSIKTDNRLINLEITTQRENSNLLSKKSSSKYIGVCRQKNTNKWQSYLYFNNKQIHLGCYDNEIDAYKDREDKLKELTSSNNS